MTCPYVLSEAAEADLRDISRYTHEQWGKEQCRSYVAALQAKAEALARGEGIFKDMSFVLPGLRMAACGSHYLFCMPQQHAPAIILAILHERMDILARLKNRLA